MNFHIALWKIICSTHLTFRQGQASFGPHFLRCSNIEHHHSEIHSYAREYDEECLLEAFNTQNNINLNLILNNV